MVIASLLVIWLINTPLTFLSKSITAKKVDKSKHNGISLEIVSFIPS